MHIQLQTIHPKSQQTAVQAFKFKATTQIPATHLDTISTITISKQPTEQKHTNDTDLQPRSATVPKNPHTIQGMSKITTRAFQKRPKTKKVY